MLFRTYSSLKCTLVVAIDKDNEKVDGALHVINNKIQ